MESDRDVCLLFSVNISYAYSVSECELYCERVLSHLLVSRLQVWRNYIGRRKFGNTCPKPKPRRQTINENVGCFDS